MEGFENLTKLICPACKGKKREEVFGKTMSYQEDCTICKGSGLVDYKTYQKFNEAKK